MGRFIYAAEVAKILNTSLREVGQWCKRGSLHPKYLKNGAVVFNADEVETLKKSSPYHFEKGPVSRVKRLKTADIKHQTKDQLIAELSKLRSRNTELEKRFGEQRRLKDIYGTLISSSIDGIIAFDRNLHYTVWNPAMEQIFGVSKESALGSYAFEIFPFLKDSGEERYFFEALDGHDVIAKDRRYRLPESDQEKYFEGYYSPLRNEMGGIIGGLAIIRDITERKQAEEERAQLDREQAARAEAEQANRSKDEFIATLSHELRTPLTSILGWARLLRSGKLDLNTIDRAYEIIERNAKVQSRLIEDLLDISRIITGTLKIEIAQIELSKVVETALDALLPSAATRKIKLNLKKSLAQDEIIADPTRLQQVINNLVSNALKFSHDEGEIDIELTSQEDNIQIIVRDYGKGIKPEFLPFVFERFRQEDTSTTKKYGGLGLGLAIVKTIVELHGGRVFAASAGEDNGATFTIELPIVNSVNR